MCESYINAILTMYLLDLCGTPHTCIYYLYTMILWRSKSVVLAMSHAYCRGGFKLESLGIKNLCHYYNEVVVLLSVILKR